MAIFNPVGVSQFLSIYLERLRSKKLIANYDSYEDAKVDVIIELVNQGTTGKASIDDMLELVTQLEEIMDFEDFFEGLGKT